MDTNQASGSSDKGTNKGVAGSSLTGASGSGMGSSGMAGTNTPGSGSASPGSSMSTSGTPGGTSSTTGTSGTSSSGTGTSSSGMSSAAGSSGSMSSGTSSGMGSSGKSAGENRDRPSWKDSDMGSESQYADYGDSDQSGKSMRDQLSDMKSDLDALIGKASSLSDQELRMARDQMMAKFGTMRHRARGMANQASQQLNQSMDVTTDYVKEKPLQSVAMAAGLGLLIGALLRRH